MSTFFISHSSSDNDFAARLRTQLEERNYNSLFLDFDPEKGIIAGQSWERTLYRKLRACRALIAVCTDNYLKSNWCFAELALARMERKPIFALLVDPLSDDINLPSILTDKQYIDLREDQDIGYERLWKGIQELGIRAEFEKTWDINIPPYPGLFAFQEKDAPIFFGREKETNKALDIINSGWREDFISILGASGSGKSSLMRAGIIPNLRHDPENWLIVGPFRPGQEPIEELAASFGETFDQNWEKIYEEILKTKNLAKLTRKYRRNTTQRQATVLIAIDQFEELLEHPLDHEANKFLELIYKGLISAGTPLIVLSSMRSDYLSSFLQHPILRKIEFNNLTLGPISIDRLRAVIEEPAKLGRIEFESGLVDRLISDTSDTNAMPLLAFMLRKLWDDYGTDGLFEIREYEALGGLHGAIAMEAEKLYKKEVKENTKKDFRNTFLKMTRIKLDGDFTNMPVPLKNLPENVIPILHQFVDHRLLRIRDNGTIEVAHEALYSAWDQLATWLSENKEFLLWKQRLALAIGEWERTQHDEDALLRGVRLQEAERWLSMYPADLNEHENLFIRDSREAGPVIKIIIRPEELARKSLIKNGVCFYRLLENGSPSQWKETTLNREVGGVVVYLKDEILQHKLFQVKIVMGDEIWESLFQHKTIVVNLAQQNELL